MMVREGSKDHRQLLERSKAPEPQLSKEVSRHQCSEGTWEPNAQLFLWFVWKNIVYHLCHYWCAFLWCDRWQKISKLGENFYFILSYVESDVCQTCKQQTIFFRIFAIFRVKTCKFLGYNFVTLFVTKCQNLQYFGVNIFRHFWPLSLFWEIAKNLTFLIYDFSSHRDSEQRWHLLWAPAT